MEMDQQSGKQSLTMKRTEQHKLFDQMRMVEIDIRHAIAFLQNSWNLGLNDGEWPYTAEQLNIDATEVDIDLENAINCLIIYRQRIKDLVEKTIQNHQKMNVE